MKIKMRLPSELVGCCTLLQTFSDNEIKLLNSQHISSESNTTSANQPVDLPWSLTLEVFSRNMNTIVQVNKKQELGFFHILKGKKLDIFIKKNSKTFKILRVYHILYIIKIVSIMSIRKMNFQFI